MTVSADAPYNANAKLSSLLDLGCTMSYGSNLQGQKDIIKQYLGYGMRNSQLCVGVQAGDWDWCTPLPEVKQIADWLNGGSSFAYAYGMTLWTFTQDIQTCTGQRTPHEWQKTIVEGLAGPGSWKVLDE